MFIKTLSVTQVTQYIKRILGNDVILRNVSVSGEISNFKHHYSGHMYFTLKDDSSRIRCVMFKSAADKLQFMPEDGMSVTVKGHVSVYERDGQYQLYADEMQQAGVGALYEAFAVLKRKLEEEGVFSESHKVAIPKFPQKVGVITSSTGAAVRDIINIISRRNPGVEILLAPVLVQGDGAPPEIVKAIEMMNRRDDVDVLIVGRGGGSIEELWAFNEESVARAIYNSRIPVISAVGHETDFTIADFAADLRAPTPSAAAELCVPDRNELLYKVDSCRETLKNCIRAVLKDDGERSGRLGSGLVSSSPVNLIAQRQQYLDTIDFKISSLMKNDISLKKEVLGSICSNLDSLSPLAVLARGYSIATLARDGSVVDDVGKVKESDDLDVRVRRGTLRCTVREILQGGIRK